MQVGAVSEGSERFLWFIGIGAVSSLVDIGLLVLFCERAGLWYLPAAILSYCCGIVVSYSLNKVLTFHDENRHYVRQFSTFAVISLSCLLVFNVLNICTEITLINFHYFNGRAIWMLKIKKNIDRPFATSHINWLTT